MNEIEYQTLIEVYKKKCIDLFNYSTELESKLMISNQVIETLTSKLNELKQK